MEYYRGAEIDQAVISEFTDNRYAKCKTCLKLADGRFFKASMGMRGYDHVWALELLPEADYPMLYENY